MTAAVQYSLFDTVSPDRDAWYADAQVIIEGLASIGEIFTVDTMRARGLAEPPHKNMWGRFVSSYHKRGVIQPAGYVHSIRPTRKGSILQAWQGAHHDG